MSPSPSLDPAELVARLHHFADHDCPEEPLYQALCRHLAGSPAGLSLLQAAPLTQQRPNLLLAAVHHLLLAEAGDPPTDPLAHYYPSVGGRRPPDGGLGAALETFMARHRASLLRLMQERRTQTNEVGRCAVLAPALAEIAREHGPALALFDFGCSAGLNLAVDRYRLRYHGPAGDWALGPEDGRPVIDCEWQGPRPGPAPAWQLVRRAGMDQAPVDVADPEALRWLQACLWPSDQVRHDRLQQAAATLRQGGWPVERAEDGLSWLAARLEDLPADVVPVLFNSWVLYYFDEPALSRHIERVHGLLRRRRLVWLNAEGPALGARLLGEAVPPHAAASDTWVVATHALPDGALCARLLARSHPHGRWLAWGAGR